MQEPIERIKQMAVEAGAVPTDDGLAFGPVELTAFAQAVARECSGICMKQQNDLRTRQKYAHAIRARFGMEG